MAGFHSAIIGARQKEFDMMDVVRGCVVHYVCNEDAVGHGESRRASIRHRSMQFYELIWMNIQYNPLYLKP